MLLMMFSLTFTNATNERLEVRQPRLMLAINGVEWGELVSTDFQIGRLQPQASQTIELQSTLMRRKLTPEQQPVWEAILNQEPVTLDISGTILAFPGGQEQTLAVEKTLDDIVLPGEWQRP